MTTISATEAKNRFGELLEAIHRSPVQIAKKGRAVAVVISVGEYRDMRKRLGELETPTKFGQLRKWRETTVRHGQDATM